MFAGEVAEMRILEVCRNDVEGGEGKCVVGK